MVPIVQNRGQRAASQYHRLDAAHQYTDRHVFRARCQPVIRSDRQAERYSIGESAKGGVARTGACCVPAARDATQW